MMRRAHTRTRTYLIAEHVVEHAEVHAPLQALGQVLPPGRRPECPAPAAPEKGQGQR